MQGYRSPKAKLILASKGLAMGTADIIPGVSGGTIALISGIYDHLILAISSVRATHVLNVLELIAFFWHGERRRLALKSLGTIEWHFLLPLLFGIGLAAGIMVQVIPFVLEHYAFYAFSFFFGLIIFSITVPYRMMKRGLPEITLLLVFALVVFWSVGLSRVSDAQLFVRQIDPPGGAGMITLPADQKGAWELRLPVAGLFESGGNESVFESQVADRAGDSLGHFQIEITSSDEQIRVTANAGPDLFGLQPFVRRSEVVNENGIETLVVHGVLSEEGDHNLLFVFFSGALAICAMILPGISGAYILVLLGQYRFVAESARDFLKTLEPGHGLVLLAFLGGVVVGIFSFVRLLKVLLARYHSLTMAALTGLMIGSLRYIWAPNHRGGDMSLLDWSIFAGIALVGGLAVFVLERAALQIGDPDAPIPSGESSAE
ncbi:MAG: DUF368 domain-containing protein [Leptospiraceae bacterium]|nr:DUF368 domain-containing protein [Leptospiraceae bacterium]